MDDRTSFVFTGVLIKEDEGYSVLCLELDVASQGETVEEAKKKYNWGCYFVYRDSNRKQSTNYKTSSRGR